jgi:O-antigen ligase
MLLVSTDFVLVASGDALAPLFQSNSIHGAVSAGLILIGAAGWLVHVWSDHDAPAWRRRLFIAIAIGVIGLAALGVLGAKSKGVWIAMMLVALIETGFAFVSVPSRRDKIAALLPIVVVAVVCFALSDRIAAVAAETMEALRGVILDMATTTHVAPESAQVRMELLYNALTVWRQHFWLGAGPDWVEMMRNAPYFAGGFTTIHNAYLEIAVRYGVLGLVAIGTIVIECVRLARRATRRGLLPPVAFHTYAMLMLFYLLAGLTNSNTHFAFGEAFVLLSCGFGLFCLFLVRTDEAREPAAVPRAAHFV